MYLVKIFSYKKYILEKVILPLEKSKTLEIEIKIGYFPVYDLQSHYNHFWSL